MLVFFNLLWFRIFQFYVSQSRSGLGDFLFSNNCLFNNYAVKSIKPILYFLLSFSAESTCKFINSFPIFIISSACYTLVFISFERRRAIMESNKPQMTLSTVFKLLPVLWFSSLVVSIPTIMEYSVETYSSGNNSGNASTTEYACGHYSVPHSLTVAVCFFVVIASFFIPLVLIFNNYIRVIIFVNKRCKVVHVTDTSGMSDIVNSNGTSGAQRNSIPTTHLSKNRLKIVKMLILMAATFAVCWLPYFLLYMYTVSI